MLTFEISFCFLLYFNLISAGKIFINQETESHRQTSQAHKHPDNESSPSKHKTDHDVLKRLHQLYHTDLQNKDTDLRQLLILKQRYIARNRIEEYETDLALDFVPDWSKIDKWSSAALQSIEIRRQKWQHILKNHSDVPLVQILNAELAKSGVNQSTFCSNIAEACFILSHNSYIFEKGPIANGKGVELAELVHHPVTDKCLRIFLHSFPNSTFEFNETKDLIQIPKSVYHKLLRKDAEVELLKKNHKFETAQSTRDPDDDASTLFHRNQTSKSIVELAFNAYSTSTTVGYDSVLDSSSSSSSSSEDTSDLSSDSDGSDDDDSFSTERRWWWMS